MRSTTVPNKYTPTHIQKADTDCIIRWFRRISGTIITANRIPTYNQA